MNSPLAFEVLDTEGRLEDLLGIGVDLKHGTEVGRFFPARRILIDDVAERDVLAHDSGRHCLGESLTHRVGHTEHTRAVLESLLGLDGAVRDDLGHTVVAVLIGDVADDLGAAAVVEVDVDVGHRHTFGVEEALEDQAVRERVELGDSHGVGRHRSGGGTTTGPHTNALRLRPGNKVGNHQEVAGEPHLFDDVDFILCLREVRFGRRVFEAPHHANGDLFFEPAGLVFALGDGESGHQVAVFEVHFAPLGDEKGVVAGFGVVAEHVPHLCGGLQVELVGVELEPVRVVQRRRRLHTQQGGVSRRVVGVGVVQVVGGQEGNIHFLGQAQQVGNGPALDIDAMVHNLSEEVLFAEDVLELSRGLFCLVILPETQARLHLATHTTGGGDNTLRVLREQLAVHAGFEVKALNGGERRQPEQVMHSLVVLRQQGHVGVRP